MLSIQQEVPRTSKRMFSVSLKKDMDIVNIMCSSTRVIVSLVETILCILLFV